MKTRISIIIPAWNAEKYIAEAIGSVKGQEEFELEIIVADDGSSDQTAKIAEARKVTVARLEHKGAAHARNAALKLSTSPFIFFLDADDILMPNALSKLYTPFEEDKSLMAVFSRAKDFYSPELSEEERARVKARLDSYGGVLPGCSLLKREVIEQVGLFDESLSSGETVKWLMSMKEKGIKTVEIDEVTLSRRIHMSNTGRKDPKGEAANYAAILRAKMMERMKNRK